MKVMHRAACACLLAALTGIVGAAEAPFYQGKRITFPINYTAGGTTDMEGRLVARHLGKHIPGNPRIVVKNMPGVAVALFYIPATGPDGEQARDARLATDRATTDGSPRGRRTHRAEPCDQASPANSSATSNFSIFPMALRGSPPTNRTTRGTL